MTAPLSVVVPCRDRPELLRGCLASLEPVLRDGHEVLVVDAHSVSPAVRDVAEAAGVTCLLSSHASASASRNTGWRAARHPSVAFLDDDCRARPGWASAVVAALAQLDAVFGQVQAEGPGHLSVLLDEQPWEVRPGDPLAALGHGANLAVRRSALQAVGGWDETLGPGTRHPGGEDKELQLRLLAAGLRVGYRPDAVVGHVQWRTRRQALAAELGYARGTGALRARGYDAPGPTAELRTAARDLRSGYQYGAVAGVVRAAGWVVGRWT